MTDCLICLYEQRSTDAERMAFLDAVLAQAGKTPQRPVIVCDTHYADMALLSERLGDVL